MFDTVFELPLARNYVAEWKMEHAVRELIQNALDSESPFEWALQNGELRIHSKFTTLGHKTLLLGSTNKAESVKAIGHFGEGYKLALLVLAREGYEVVLLNGNKAWRPEFRMSKRFDSELLCIIETTADIPNEGLTFIIKLKDDDDEAKIRSCCLQMQDNIGEIIEVPQGRILLDRKGELYVGSLFICTTQLDHSYDIEPQYIKLERDRQTVNSWNLQLITKDMWFASRRMECVARMIDKNSPDTYHADIGTPQIVSDACYRHFKEKHPGAVIAKDQQHLEQLVDAGMTRVIVSSGSTHYNVVSESRSYRALPTIKVKTPREVLSNWIDQWCPTVAEHDKHEILNQADKWRLK